MLTTKLPDRYRDSSSVVLAQDKLVKHPDFRRLVHFYLELSQLRRRALLNDDTLAHLDTVHETQYASIVATV